LSWLDRIFGKKEEKPEETKMSLKDVESFLAGKLEKDLEPLKETVKKEAKKEYAGLQLVASDMQDHLKILEKAPYSERNDPMFIRKVVGSRKSFVNKMKVLIRQTQKPIGEDMTSILGFHNETAKLINTINARTVGEYAFLKELFEKEAEKVIQGFRQIVEIDKKLGKTVKEFRESNAELLKAQELAAEVLKLTEELERKEADELEKALKEKEDRNKEIEDELKKLPDSDEWKEFLEMQKVGEELRTTLENKKSDFVRAVANVEKPLKKYNWTAKNKILDDYVQHSFESILSEDPKGEVLMSVLKDMKTKITEGEMELKESEKLLAVIERMIEDDTMGKVLGEYSELSKELKMQEEKIASHEILKRKSGLEAEMVKLKREMGEIKVERKRAGERKKRMQTEKNQKLKELEKLLNTVTGKRVLLEAHSGCSNA